jgi:hypothetical protein
VMVGILRGGGVVEQMGGAWGSTKSVGISPVRRKSEVGGRTGKDEGRRQPALDRRQKGSFL